MRQGYRKIAAFPFGPAHDSVEFRFRMKVLNRLEAMRIAWVWTEDRAQTHLTLCVPSLYACTARTLVYGLKAQWPDGVLWERPAA